MYLHIGDNEIISTEKIIGVFSLSHYLKAKENTTNYKKLLAGNMIRKISKRKSKSLVLLANGSYIESSISTMTLSKRLVHYQSNILNGVCYECS